MEKDENDKISDINLLSEKGYISRTVVRLKVSKKFILASRKY